MAGGGAATRAWVAGHCNRISGQESTEEEEKLHGDLGGAAKSKSLRPVRKVLKENQLLLHDGC